MESIYLDSPNLNEIINSMCAFNVNKTIGHDNIPSFFLRIAAYIISPFLNLVHFSFTKGIFPERCTLSKAIPLTKKTINSNNYRPIFILTSQDQAHAKQDKYRFFVQNFFTGNSKIVFFVLRKYLISRKKHFCKILLF